MFSFIGRMLAKMFSCPDKIEPDYKQMYLDLITSGCNCNKPKTSNEKPDFPKSTIRKESYDPLEKPKRY